MARSSVESMPSSEGEEDEGNVVIGDTDRISMSQSFPQPANSSTSTNDAQSKILGEEDPESPGSRSNSSGDGGITRQSLSEGDGSSSEGVLVEHPLNPDQDSRSHGDPESSVLVNIDGSMHEGDRESEDGGREDTFVDAPDDLGFSDGRSSTGLDHPIVLVDIDQSNEISRLTMKLEATAAECAKYKEEREAYGRELVALHQELKSMVDYSAGIAEGAEGVDDILALSPLNSVVMGCAKLASHLKSNMNEQRTQVENYVRDLSSIVSAREEEIEALNFKVAEKQSSEGFVERLLSLTSVVNMDDEDVFDGFSLVEKRTAELVERYSLNLSEVYQLAQCLSYVGPDFKLSHHHDLRIVFEAARRELLEGKNKEEYFLRTIDELKQEKDSISEQLHEAKALLEQAENKFKTAKEKLGMAVTKGKSLVQQRDSLKQLLNEKTAALERCAIDLDARTEELSKHEAMLVSVQNLMSGQNAFQNELEVVLSQVEYPMDGASMEAIERVSWLIHQKKLAAGEIQGYNRLRGLLCSADLPEALLSSDSEVQLKWVLSSYVESKEKLTKLQTELSSVESALASSERKLLETEKKNDSLTASIIEERGEFDSLKFVNQELDFKYNEIVEKMSHISSERNQLVDALMGIYGVAEGESSLAVNALIEVCLGKVNEWKRVAHESSFYPEGLEVLQRLLFLREMDLALYEMILGEENTSRTAVTELSNRLMQANEELTSLRNENVAMKKDLDRVEERSALIREKLSMAVKKGKGLLQDRDSLKLSLDEKNSEIESLKHDLQGQESETAKLKEQIETLKAEVMLMKQLEINEVSLKEEIEKLKELLQDSNYSLSEVVTAVDGICLAYSLTEQTPPEKLKKLSNYISELESVKSSMSQELESSKVEVLSLASGLTLASSTIRELEKGLSEMERNTATQLEEKEDAQLQKASAEQELKTVKKDADSLTDKLTQSYVTIKNLEDALSVAENSISSLTHKKKENEEKSEEEIKLLRTRLVTCENELSVAHCRIQNQSDELAFHLRNLELVTKEDGLSFMMVEGFKKNAEYLQDVGLLIDKICDKVTESELEARPVSEKDPHFLKLFSIDQPVDAFGTEASILMERFRNFSGYIDDHICLLSQGLQSILNDVTRVMDQKQKQEEKLKELEAHKHVQELKVLELQKNMTLLLSASRKASHDLLVEFDDAVRESESSVQDECENVAIKLLDAVERAKIETQKFSSLKFISEDHLMLLKERLLDTLFDRLKTIEVPFRVLDLGDDSFASPIKREITSGPVEKLLYILDSVSKFQFLVNSMIHEKDEMQSRLQRYISEVQQFREASEIYAVTNQNLEAKKADLANLYEALEKIVMKFGGSEFLESKRPVDTRGLLHILERLVVSSVQDTETLKSKVQELGAKLLETQASNENLSSRIKLLEDSESDIGKERTSSEGSSVVIGPEIVEIEDGGHVGKKVSAGSAVAMRITRKASSDHLVLSVDPESERLIGPPEIDDKGHVFKSLNASGLIPKDGKHLADRIDGIWVSAGRLLMGRPEARMGLLVYSIVLHIWVVLATIL
ncbi:TGN-related, localized SYP41 interacting protein isoform X2 [Wolffia australiana]